MKFSFLLVSLALVSCSHQKTGNWSDREPASDSVTSAMFSPWEGTQAFDKMYKAISSAKHDAKITVYSWSDSGFDKAIEEAVKNGVNVKVVLHPDLAKEANTQSKVAKLEALQGKGRAAFKVAPRNMHEKFAVIDGEFLVNSSANMSGGAKTKYSENFVFMSGPDFIVDNFDNEFSVLWNSSKDVLTHPKDVVEDRLPFDPKMHQTKGKEVTFYSSSMNYDYVENAAASAAAQEGKFIKLVAKGGGKGPYTVRDAIISAINNAKTSVHGSFNHFNMKEISEALVNAAKRGVDVKLTVDNQEFRERFYDDMIEMTPHFVDNWKKLPGNASKSIPVRVKFYSHYPNPAKWYLNHHKFFVVDQGSSNAVLFTGSYNLSETAEHNQFDNMVSYAGSKYSKLQKSFIDEFNKLWNLERSGDKPSKEGLQFFTTVNNGSLPIHTQKPISLTWEEVVKLRADVRAIAPEFLKQMNRQTSSCQGYDIAKKALWGCH